MMMAVSPMPEKKAASGERKSPKMHPMVQIQKYLSSCCV
jgi:hypothetical protein